MCVCVCVCLAVAVNRVKVRGGVAVAALANTPLPAHQYAAANLSLTRVTAKIGMDNAPSLRLFDTLGFRKVWPAPH